MTVNHAIQVLRREFTMSQQAFATRLGVGIATVVRWESGQCKPSTATLHKLLALARKKQLKPIVRALETHLITSFDSLRNDIISSLSDHLITISSNLAEAIHDMSKSDAERWVVVERAMWQTEEAKSLLEVIANAAESEQEASE